MCCSSSSRSLPPVRASGSIIRIIRAMSGHTRWPLWTAFRPRSRSGHPAAGAAVTEEVLRRLRYDRATTEFVTQLVAVHGRPIPDDLRGMRRMLVRLGAPVCRALIQLRCADAIGTGTADAAEQTARCEAALSLLAQAEKGCSSVSTLAVSGRDLLALGMTQGPAVGAVLKRLLDAVLDGSAPNDRASLLKLASEIGNNA